MWPSTLFFDIRRLIAYSYFVHRSSGPGSEPALLPTTREFFERAHRVVQGLSVLHTSQLFVKRSTTRGVVSKSYNLINGLLRPHQRVHRLFSADSESTRAQLHADILLGAGARVVAKSIGRDCLGTLGSTAKSIPPHLALSSSTT